MLSWLQISSRDRFTDLTCIHIQYFNVVFVIAYEHQVSDTKLFTWVLIVALHVSSEENFSMSTYILGRSNLCSRPLHVANQLWLSASLKAIWRSATSCSNVPSVNRTLQSKVSLLKSNSFSRGRIQRRVTAMEAVLLVNDCSFLIISSCRRSRAMEPDRIRDRTSSP